MMDMLKAEGDHRALGQFEVFDTYKYQGGRGKGYATWMKEQEATKLAELKKKLEEQAANPPKKNKKGKAANSEN
jgi:hypothetical protein